MDNSIQERPCVSLNSYKVYKNANAKAYAKRMLKEDSEPVSTQGNDTANISFKGNGGSKFWYKLKKLSNYMSNPSEVTNQIIAAIGTAIIAPAVILVSPGKGDENDKDKKKFQALRQPLSAVLAFGFQFPVTQLINSTFDKVAYTRLTEGNIFNDRPTVLDKETGKKSNCIGRLIPDKKYIGKNGSVEVLDMLRNFDAPYENGKSLADLLKDDIRNDYAESNLEISEEEVNKLAENKKLRKKFATDKYAAKMHDKFINEKFDELKSKNLIIDDSELVGDDIKEFVKESLLKDKYKKLEEEAKLSGFDKFMKNMGWNITKKLKDLKKAQDKFLDENALKYLKEKSPEMFGPDADKTKRLKQFIKTRDAASQKLYKNKVFWISVLTNLGMVSISCCALNYIHPRFKNWWCKVTHKDNAHVQNSEKQPENKKVEVRA